MYISISLYKEAGNVFALHTHSMPDFREIHLVFHIQTLITHLSHYCVYKYVQISWINDFFVTDNFVIYILFKSKHPTLFVIYNCKIYKWILVPSLLKLPYTKKNVYIFGFYDFNYSLLDN